VRTTDFERMAKKYHRNHVQPSRQMKDVDPTKLGSELKEFFKEEAHEPEHEVGLSDGLGERVASAAAAGKEVGNRVAEGRIHDAGKSPADRGHEGGLIGGPARAEVLTGAEKEKIARKGGYARWNEAKSERDE
jgi:hypothetical protein